DTPMDRGKVLWEEDLKKLTEPWGRYLDKDGDGVPYRTFPGNRLPGSSYFTRGTGHDPFAKYSEDSNIWEANMDRLKKKFQTAKNYLPKPVLEMTPNAQEGIIAFGSTMPAVYEARALMAENGKKLNVLRLRALPLADEVREFVKSQKKVYIVEMNRDGQLYKEILIAMPELADKLVSVAYSDGMPPTAKRIQKEILAKENK
ncbi:MAG: 2-oxoacid:acceptor oxidoreductase subunit alpha, partial [Chloroflexota bacterium]